MTKIGKCLAVATMVASLLFLGIVWAVTAGGPNWRGMAEELEDYVFERSEGEKPTWTAKHRVTDETVGSDPVLPKLIVRVRQHIQQAQNARLQGDPANNQPGLDDQIQYWTAQIEEARALNEIDRQALVAHQEALAVEIAAVSEAIDQTSAQIVQKTQDVQAVQVLAERRREEVYRLRHQVEEIQTDLYRVAAQNVRLRDLLRRGEGTLDRVLRRQEQLIEGGADEPYEEPVAEGGAAPERGAALAAEAGRASASP